MTHMEVIEGTVEAVNDRGVRLNGEWYNVSKFRAVELPKVGARVQLGIDTKGFIMDIKDVDSEPVADLRAGQERVIRLGVLQFAASFGASRPDLKSADVLKIAESWLEWVQRDA